MMSCSSSMVGNVSRGVVRCADNNTVMHRHGNFMVDNMMNGLGMVHSCVMGSWHMNRVSVCSGRVVVICVLHVRVGARLLMMGVVGANMAIIVVHLEDKVSILDVGLAAHEKRRVILKAPVVASVPLLGIEVVEVVSPAQREVLLGLVVVVDLNEVVFGVPRHGNIIKEVAPWGPARSPEVHHELGRHVEEVDVLGVLGLAGQLIVDVPRDVVRGPLDGVGVEIGARIEASGVVVILSAISPDNVHGEWVLMDGGNELDIDLVPAMGPILSSVSEERLNGTHLSGVLHPDDEFTVLEPFLGANFTRKVVSVGGARDHKSCNASHL